MIFRGSTPVLGLKYKCKILTKYEDHKSNLAFAFSSYAKNTCTVFQPVK